MALLSAVTPIRDVCFVGIDFESAGVRQGDTDVPIQIGWGILEHDEIDPTEFFRRYLFTNKPITWSASKVHGISAKHLEGAQRFEDLWPELSRSLQGRVLVAHGHGTEKRFLGQFPTHNLGPWVDTLTLARRWCGGLKSHRLGDVVTGLGLEAELRQLCPDS
ncbi:MAG: 3'-5' exonuclease, partial [Verrucomicrobiota bacterium]